MSEPHCPHCGSRSVKKSSAIFEQGQSNYSGSSSGVGVSSTGRIGIYGGSHSGQRITKIAEKNAPPAIDAQKIGCIAVLAPFALTLFGFIANGLLGALTLGGISLIVVPVAVILFALFAPKSEVQSAADAVYARQWSCNKCSEKFEY